MKTNKTNNALAKWVMLLSIILLGFTMAPKTVEAKPRVNISGTYLPDSIWPTSIQFNFSPASYSGGLKKYWWVIYRNGSTYRTGSQDGWLSDSTEITEPGTYTALFTALGNDDVENKQVNVPGSWSIKTDNIAPTAYYDPFSTNGEWRNHVDYSIDIIDEGGSGLNYWWFKYNWDTLRNPNQWNGANEKYTSTRRVNYIQQPGIRRMRVEAYDNANNKGITDSGVFYVDPNPPFAEVSPLSRTNWSSSDVTVRMEYGDYKTEGGVIWNSEYEYASGVADSRYLWTTSPSTPSLSSMNKVYNQITHVSQNNSGNWHLHYYVADYAGNVKTKYAGPFNIDKTSPSGSFSPSSSGWTNGSASTTFYPTDAHSGVNYWDWEHYFNGERVDSGSYSGSSAKMLSASQHGRHEFKATVVDNVGLSSNVSSGSFYVDKISPTGYFSPDSRGWNNTTAYTTFYGSDSDSGVSRIVWRVNRNGSLYDSGTEYSSSKSFSFSSTGTYDVTATVYDGAGNSNTYSTGSFYVDKTNPSGTYSPNSRTWDTGNATTTFTPYDAHTGIDYYTYYVYRNGSLYKTNTVNGNSSTTFNFTTPGDYHIETYVVDGVGNGAYITSGSFGIDRTNPSGTFSPHSHTWTNQTLSIRFNPTDDLSGVNRWSYRAHRNGNTYSSHTYNDGIARNITLSDTGEYTIEVDVRDRAGNESSVTSGLYQIDKVFPNGTFSGNPTEWTNKPTTITFNATDSGGSGVRRVRSPQGTWVSSNTIQYTVYENGRYTFRVEDHAGNGRDVSIDVTRVDTIPPTGDGTLEPSDWTNEDVIIEFTGEDNDNGSGVEGIIDPDGNWHEGDEAEYPVEENGEYEFTVIDKVGNEQVIEVIVTNIDKVAPAVSEIELKPK